MADLGMGNTEEEALNEYGALINNFDQDELVNQDHLTLLYTTDSEQFKEGNNIASNIHNSVIKPALKDLKGLGRFYVFDCQHPQLQNVEELELQGIAASCDVEKNPQRMPSLMLFRQPETRINPYTQKPMLKTQVPYREAGIDLKSFKQWFTKHMTDFTHTVASKSEYDTLIKNENDRDVNKVLLFTKKDTVAPVFKALSAEFRDRLRFNVIPIPEKKATKSNLDLKAKYEVDELPQLVVEQTYDSKT